MNWRETLRPNPTLGDVDVAQRLGIGFSGHGMIRCPGHDDRRASLSWRWRDGRLLLYCFAGCSYEHLRG